jgi:hypothetical protein
VTHDHDTQDAPKTTCGHEAVLAARDQELRQLNAVFAENARRHRSTIRRVDELLAAIADIDAHATPVGLADENDPDGNPHHYLVTVGSLHRALGKLGHTAAPCRAEADLEEARAEIHRLRRMLDSPGATEPGPSCSENPDCDGKCCKRAGASP